VTLRIEAPAPEALQERLPLCRDPHDQKFLEAALAAKADFLITKDQALLELARCVSPFRIVTPAEFGRR
jgi:predicted nucleic acid-binding protein